MVCTMLRGAHSVVGWSECAEIEARVKEVEEGLRGSVAEAVAQVAL